MRLSGFMRWLLHLCAAVLVVFGGMGLLRAAFAWMTQDALYILLGAYGIVVGTLVFFTLVWDLCQCMDY